jgi:16S rRNA (adenine(1408)-N(1))-methyltransferase
VVIDLGTGDGRAVLGAASHCPERLIVGVDANAAGMAEASRRAAANRRRGGRPNALFVVAAAEALPEELNGLADLVTINFPWGSLLRGVLGAEPAVLASVARVLRPRGRMELLVSVTEHDRASGLSPLGEHDVDALAKVYASNGLELRKVRPATAAEVAATRSTWGKRLAAGAQRPTWRITVRKP